MLTNVNIIMTQNRNEYMKEYMRNRRAKLKTLGIEENVKHVNIINKKNPLIAPEEKIFLNRMFRLMIRRRIITTTDEDIFQDILNKF